MSPPSLESQGLEDENLHSVSPHKDSIGVRVFLHRLLQASREVFLKRGVIDDRDAKSIVESHHALALATGDTLDLLNVANFKAGVRALFALNQEGHQDRPLRMSVDTAASPALKSGKEQWRACRGLQVERLANVFAIGRRVLGRREFQDEDVVGFHHLLLHTRRSDEYMVIATNGSLMHNK